MHTEHLRNALLLILWTLSPEMFVISRHALFPGSSRLLFYTLRFLNIPTNTSHNGINQGNVGAEDRGHRKPPRSASKVTRTARVYS